MNARINKQLVIYTIFLIVSIIGVTLSSTVSIIYDNNISINTDLNTYLDAGNAIKNGKLLYNDIVDTKGPLFLYFFAILIKLPFNIFNILYIIEICLAFIFCIIQYKVAKLHSNEDIICIISTIMSCILYNAVLSSFLGGTFEEYAIILISYIFYLVEKSIVNKIPLTHIQLFIIGLLCSIIFLSKYSILLFIIPVGMYYLYYNRTNIIKTVLVFLFGFIILILPLFIYFTYKHNLYNYFYYQFLENSNRTIQFYNISIQDIITMVLPFIFIILSIKHTYKYTIMIIIPIITINLLIQVPFLKTVCYYYYVPAYYVGTIYIIYALRVLKDNLYKICLIILCLTCILLQECGCIDNNYKKQKVVSTIISSIDKINSNTTESMPNIPLNLGINYYYNITPDYKYYYNGPTTIDQIDEYINYITNKKYKFIILDTTSRQILDYYDIDITKYYTLYKNIKEDTDLYIRKTK